MQRHHLLWQILTLASMTAKESSVKSATAGFSSAKQTRPPKPGLSTVPSAVLHPHQLLRLDLESRGWPSQLSSIPNTRYLFVSPIPSSSAYRHHHNISSRWFQHTLRHHEHPRRRTVRQVPQRLPPLNHRLRHNNQTHLYLHPLLAPAVSLAGETPSSVRHSCAQTHCCRR